MAGEIFISYRRSDQARARQLHGLLLAEGVTSWYDAQVGAGEDWRAATARALENSKIFVLLFSANAAASSDIAKELAAAVLEKKLIVPVRLENIGPKGAFLYELASRNWINAYEDTDTTLAELAKSLVHLLQTGAQEQTGLGDIAPAASVSHRPLPISASDVTQAPAGERRLVTVMSVDLVDTARLSGEVDPEVMADLLTGYRNCVARGVAAAGGRVVPSGGDDVLACFGWPEGREDAAECAIRAGFLVIAEVARLDGPQGYQPRCRVGIATGLVVVAGEMNGNKNAVRFAGEAPNLAVGLQRLGAPGTMAISDATHRQVGRQFEYENLPERAVGEFSAPVRAWRPLREAAHLSRFQAARAVKTSFIGRVHELSLLTDRWRMASEGSGRTVVILAEAGMGKSRMVDALRLQIGGESHAAMTWQCSPYHQTKPFYPVLEHVTHAAGIVDADGPAGKLQKLGNLLSATGMPSGVNLPLFAQLLGIAPDAGFVPSVLPPNQVRAATIAALIEWLQRIATATPLLLVIEDAHWIDASTMELLNRLVDAVADLPLLVVITARPEFVSPWSGRADVSTIGLDRLSNRDCEALVREVAGPAALREGTVGQILSRSDGNPLFLEELSAAVKERNAATAVPDSLQSSLMARLDRLGDVKQTAQICSVLGRRFARPLLAHVVATPAQLDSHLALLVEHGVIRPIGYAGEARYEFKHALVRDAAYESLLLSRRRQLHEACGLRLEEFFADVVRSEPELLAHHFSLACIPAKASAYAEQAGDRATAACAFQEAITSYEEALRQTDLLTAGVDNSRQTLGLLLKLGPAIGMIRGAQDPMLGEVYRRAEALSRTADDNNALFKAVWGLWYHANISHEFGDAREFSQQLVHIGEQSGDEDLALEALHCRWSSAIFRGDYGLCAADAQRGLALYDRHRHHKLGLVFGGHDPGVCAFGCMGQALVLAGDVRKGFESVEAAIALGESLDHPGSLAHGLLLGMISSTITRSPDLLRRYAENMLELSRKFGLPPQQAMASYHLAWMEAEVGDRARGLDQMEALYGRVTAIGPITLLYKVMYIDQMLKASRAQDALSFADKAVAELRYRDEGQMLPELLRLRGDCLAALGRNSEARAELVRAEAMAERDGAALLRLRAANSLYREAGAESKQILERALMALPSDWAGPDVLLARHLLAG
jgi:class 3 adenylate cyclase